MLNSNFNFNRLHAFVCKYYVLNVSTNEQVSLIENVLVFPLTSQTPSTCSLGNDAFILYVFPNLITLKWKFHNSTKNQVEIEIQMKKNS